MSGVQHRLEKKEEADTNISENTAQHQVNVDEDTTAAEVDTEALIRVQLAVRTGAKDTTETTHTLLREDKRAGQMIDQDRPGVDKKHPEGIREASLKVAYIRRKFRTSTNGDCKHSEITMTEMRGQGSSQLLLAQRINSRRRSHEKGKSNVQDRPNYAGNFPGG